MACISVGRLVQALLHALQVPGQALGHDRTVLLGGIAVSAGAMHDAVKAFAGGRGLGAVRFEPDRAVQAVMDALAQSTTSARAARLGFRHSAGIEEIVAEYALRSAVA